MTTPGLTPHTNPFHKPIMPHPVCTLSLSKVVNNRKILDMVDIYPPETLTASLEQKPKVEYNQGSVRYFLLLVREYLNCRQPCQAQKHMQRYFHQMREKGRKRIDALQPWIE